MSARRFLLLLSLSLLSNVVDAFGSVPDMPDSGFGGSFDCGHNFELKEFPACIMFYGSMDKDASDCAQPGFEFRASIQARGIDDTQFDCLSFSTSESECQGQAAATYSTWGQAYKCA